MERILLFLKELFSNPKINIFLIVLFSIFAIADFIAGSKLLCVLAIIIVISEIFNLRDNLKKQKAKTN